MLDLFPRGPLGAQSYRAGQDPAPAGDRLAVLRQAPPGVEGLAEDLRAVPGEDRIEAHLPELGALLSSEQGKPMEGFAGLGAMFEMGGCLAWIRYTASLDLPVEVIQDNDDARIEVHRKPVGVVGSITPWNYPLLITCWHIIPGLLAGCTVVAKPSEYTPLTVLKAMHLINDLLPPGVLNVVTGSGDIGAGISAHPGIDKIVFTGSTATGKRIMESAAGNLKRLTLELGGNDAAIVLPDTNIEEANASAPLSRDIGAKEFPSSIIPIPLLSR